MGFLGFCVCERAVLILWLLRYHFLCF